MSMYPDHEWALAGLVFIMCEGGEPWWSTMPDGAYTSCPPAIYEALRAEYMPEMFQWHFCHGTQFETPPVPSGAIVQVLWILGDSEPQMSDFEPASNIRWDNPDIFAWRLIP